MDRVITLRSYVPCICLTQARSKHYQVSLLLFDSICLPQWVLQVLATPQTVPFEGYPFSNATLAEKNVSWTS